MQRSILSKTPANPLLLPLLRQFMDFEQYLTSKKIDIRAFRQHEAERFQEWESLFEQLHADSFTAQKKFLLNDIRRKYLLKMADN